MGTHQFEHKKKSKKDRLRYAYYDSMSTSLIVYEYELRVLQDGGVVEGFDCVSIKVGGLQ